MEKLTSRQTTFLGDLEIEQANNKQDLLLFLLGSVHGNKVECARVPISKSLEAFSRASGYTFESECWMETNTTAFSVLFKHIKEKKILPALLGNCKCETPKAHVINLWIHYLCKNVPGEVHGDYVTLLQENIHVPGTGRALVSGGHISSSNQAVTVTASPP
jgi:hypothetical protein